MKHLSNFELDRDARESFRIGKESLHQDLLRFAEIDRRKLYLDYGQKNLFDYMTLELGYDPASAQRRIDGARLLRDLPDIEKVEIGKRLKKAH